LLLLKVAMTFIAAAAVLFLLSLFIQGSPPRADHTLMIAQTEVV
jgi:hypothetical protein